MTSRGMPHLRKCGLVFCLVPPLAAAGGVFLPELDFRLRNEFHSAYISSSSGNIGETRPMLTQTFSGHYNLGEWGTAGGYAWTRSALTGQKDEYRRRAFDSFEYGVEYSYTWKFSGDLGLYNYIDHLWSPSPGWYERSTTFHGVLIEQALKNPYITPYYKFLGAYYPHQWETLKIGVRQPFSLMDGRLTVTPYAELINGDSRRYEAKYGDEPAETYCNLRLMSSELGCSFVYKISSYIASRLRLRNWNLIDHAARVYERNRDVSWAKTWLPAATLSLDVSF